MTNIKCPSHLLNQWALVTGASSGIGKEIAMTLAQLGMNVFITARRQHELTKLKDTIESMQVKCNTLVLDLTSPNASKTLVEALAQDAITPSVFINNAGRGVYGDFQSMNPQEIEQMLTLNVTTMTMLCRHVASIMPKDSFMLLVASTICFQPTPLYTAYADLKAMYTVLGLH